MLIVIAYFDPELDIVKSEIEYPHSVVAAKPYITEVSFHVALNCGRGDRTNTVESVSTERRN